MDIMTYDGNKFDLRVWAAVTSLDPLRMYLLGTGIPKVCIYTCMHPLGTYMHAAPRCVCLCIPKV